MAVIRYSVGKLLLSAFVIMAAAGFFLCVLLRPEAFMNRQGRYSGLLRVIAENDWLSGGLFALLAAGAVVIAALAFGDRIALAIGPRGVEVRTAMGRHEAGWGQVAGIGFEKSARLAGSAETLTVRLRRDAGEKKVRIATAMLAHSRAEIDTILADLDRPAAGPTVTPAPVPRGGFGRRQS